MATPPPVLRGDPGYASISDRISAIVLARSFTWRWTVGLLVCGTLALAFIYGVVMLFAVGVGLFGINIPAAWGFPIVNVVWWIGIGHAGTLISAVLLLTRQPWRTSINRFAEAMTIFAVAIAGLWPILHLGRPWFFYWLVPYPATMEVWPQWRSPLVWDFFAIFTYVTVSLLFWYLGLVPDLATLRDRAKNRLQQVLYGLGSLGWRGDALHWQRFEVTYLLLAGLATPLVVSVHSVIALDFAVTLVPGYHSTLFPPYFVAGALYSGFCMVATLAVPLRHYFGLHDFITARHLDNIGKLLLASGMVVAYGYAMEAFIAWYSGSEFHRYMMWNRAFGPYAPVFWAMLGLNVGLLQLLWWRRVRTSPLALFALSILINAGMWLERYVIVITSEHRDFLPSAWRLVAPTPWDWLLLAGSLGLFFFLMLMFIRLLPAISMFEMRELSHDRGQAP